MEEELKERMEKTDRLLEEVKEHARRAELDGIRHRYLHAYAAGQYEAWATLMDVIRRLNAKPTSEEEEDGQD